MLEQLSNIGTFSVREFRGFPTINARKVWERIKFPNTWGFYVRVVLLH